MRARFCTTQPNANQTFRGTANPAESRSQPMLCTVGTRQPGSCRRGGMEPQLEVADRHHSSRWQTDTTARGGRPTLSMEPAANTHPVQRSRPGAGGGGGGGGEGISIPSPPPATTADGWWLVARRALPLRGVSGHVLRGLHGTELRGEGAGRSLTGKKERKCSVTQFSQKSPRALRVFNHGWWRLAVGGWRLAVGGDWRLAVGNWRLVAVGGWRLAVGGWRRLAVGSWQLAVGGGWRLAVGGWRRLAVGSWQLAVGGGWRLAVGGWRLAVGGDWRLAVGNWRLVAVGCGGW